MKKKYSKLLLICIFCFVYKTIQSQTSPVENVLLTQVIRADNASGGTIKGNFIELKNTGVTTIGTNKIIVALFKNVSGPLVGILPDATFTIPNPLGPGDVVSIKNTTATINAFGPVFSNNNVTNFGNDNDLIIITSSSGINAWANRVDTFTKMVKNTCYVRNDFVKKNNKLYIPNEWTAFVDDSLDPDIPLSAGGPERLHDDPLIKDLNNSRFQTSNLRVGVHRLGSTKYQTFGTPAGFDNGYPDRSRLLVVDKFYATFDLNNIHARSVIIKNNSVFFVLRGSLIVTDSVTIEKNSEIRLRLNANLIQTHAGTKNVYGLGKLYSEKESNSNSVYYYNYFSSPVNNVGENVFTLEKILRDGTGYMQPNSTPKQINFTSALNGQKTDPITISNRWIYSFTNKGDDTSNFDLKESTGDFNSVDGFTMKGPGQKQNYMFVGTPKDGDLSLSISPNQFYLVGNPYPSLLHSTKFIEDNLSATDGVIYLWDHVGVADNSVDIEGHRFDGYIGGYAVQNLTMSLRANMYTQNNTNPSNGTPYIGGGTYRTPELYIPVGQGFFVAANSTGGTVTFKNKHRRAYVPGTSGTRNVFFKTKKLKKLTTNNQTTTNKFEETINREAVGELDLMPKIKLGINYTNKENLRLHQQMGVTFDKNNSFAYEPGYDAVAINDGETNAAWKFDNDDRRFVITGVSEITENLEVPLEIKVGEGNNNIPLSIDIDEWQNIDREVYLLDKLTDQTQPLDKGVAYLNLASGTYTDRFAIAFKSHKTLSSETIESNSITVYNTSKHIEINNYGNSIIKAVELYNVSGQKMNEWKNIENKRQQLLEIDNLHKQIYIVKLITNKGSLSKKFMIE